MVTFAEFLEEALKRKLLDAAVRQSQQGKNLLKKVPESGGRQMSTRRLYHGTSQSSSREISQGGYRTDAGVNRQMAGRGVYTTSDPEVAKGYAADRALKRGESGPGSVRKFRVPTGSSVKDIEVAGGAGDPKNKGFKMQVLKPEQASKYDITGKPTIDLSKPQKGEVKSALKAKTTRLKSPALNPTSNPNRLALPSAEQRAADWKAKALKTAAERRTARELGRKSTALATRPSSALSSPKTGGITKALPGIKPKAGLGRLAGPAFAALDVATTTADERAKGSGWGRSLAKGATVAAGSLLGGTAGLIGGGGLGSAALGIAGASAGSAAAEKAFDTIAGANAAQRKAMAAQNRQRQSGGGLSGIGGKTTFDTKKGTMTTGAGSQKKTVKLGKTSIVTDPTTGKQDVGHLAYKGGKAVYKRAQDPSTLAQTSSNPLERVGRTLFAGAYKKQDVAAKQKALEKARQSDAKRQKDLGVKYKPGG